MSVNTRLGHQWVLNQTLSDVAAEQWMATPWPRFAIPVALLPGAMGRRDNERHSAAYGAGPNVRICR
jgi:hypothetical protein